MRLSLIAFSASLLIALGILVDRPMHYVHTFVQPVDALSLRTLGQELKLEVRGLGKSGWSEWFSMELETEDHPNLQETNMILFPEASVAVEVRGHTFGYVLHPITLDGDPASYQVASRLSFGKPRILKRHEWGADESYTFAYAGDKPVDIKSDAVATDARNQSDRVKDCIAAQKNYPQEFEVARTVTHDPAGRKYYWERQYTDEIRHIFVHHSAIKASRDTRTPVEQVQALYEYHSNSRGWGDIGYHYLIDREGQIYEGRAGGDYVIGGHAYCGNNSSVGIVVLGNFEVEKPTDAQSSSLKWLLNDLTDKYDLNPRGTNSFHGRDLPVILGHNSVSPTLCPGYYMSKALPQIRSQVAARDFASKVVYSVRRNTARVLRQPFSIRSRSDGVDKVIPLGDTTFTGRPGGFIHFTVQYNSSVYIERRKPLVPVKRSNSTIGIWQDTGSAYARVRSELVAPETIRKDGKSIIRMRVQLPRQAGTYSVDLGDTTFTFHAQGRRAPQPKAAPTRQSFTPDQRENTQTPGYRRGQAREKIGVQKTSSSPSVKPTITSSAKGPEGHIRIRLSFTGEQTTVQSTVRPVVNGESLRTRSVQLSKQGANCRAVAGGQTVAEGTVRIDADRGTNEILGWRANFTEFRGVLECRVIDGQLVLINELPLEEYLAGLGEEPDSVKYEMQKVIAIAARSYATFYLDPKNRKFPGMPYDGSDTGASFQNYLGFGFEKRNPKWVKATRATKDKVVMKGGEVIKAAYFSSSDGRTRSPAELGWRNYPHEEVFAAKDDSWCVNKPLHGHGVGLSACGANGQIAEGRSAEEVLKYYYAGTTIERLR